jgi:DNA modification methylase
MTSIKDLKSDHKNARKRTDRSAKLIAESLQRFGAARSIVIDEENRILAGNGTIEGAKAAGIKNVRVIETDGTEIIAVKRTGLSEDEKIGLALADNRTSDLSDWDKDMLQQLSAEHDLAPWFDADDLAEILGTVEQLPAEGLTDADDVPEAPEEPVTKPGDVWLLGKHRVMCGDSTVITDVERLMDGKKADMVFTDPPYGMDLNTDFQDIHTGATTGSNHRKVLNDDKEFDPACIFAIKSKDVLIWGADYFHHKLPAGGSWYCWDKTLGDFEGRIGNELELLWSKVPHKRIVFRHKWVGYNGLQSQDTRTRLHPNQKPIELLVQCLELFEHKLVLDLFGGSGSTLIACEKTSRHCRMMELDPCYCDVIVKRWEDFTGKKAILEEAPEAF